MAQQTAAETEPNTTTVEEQIISKITMANIGCKPALVTALPDGQSELPIARLYGTLMGIGTQEDKQNGGFFSYLKGNFEAINMQTGEVYKSGKMFLPKGIHELVEAVVKNAGENANVDFAFEVRSIKANNPIKYSYKVLPLVSPEKSDALKALRERVMKAGAVVAKQLSGAQRGTGPTVIDQTEKKKSA